MTFIMTPTFPRSNPDVITLSGSSAWEAERDLRDAIAALHFARQELSNLPWEERDTENYRAHQDAVKVAQDWVDWTMAEIRVMFGLGEAKRILRRANR